MTTPPAAPLASPTRRKLTVFGFVLLMASLLCHLLSAQAIGGYYVAYRDHIVGFVVLSVLSGALLWGLSRWFWRGRHDITLAVLGVLQLAIGILVYINRFHIN